MIKSITIKNTLDETDNGLTIELGAPEKTGLWVKSIKGIGPGKADINTTDFASSDGGVFNSSRSQIRNITLTLGILEYTDAGGIYHSVEWVRHSTYKWFSKKRPVTVIVTTDRTELLTYGYIESVDPDIFNKKETMAISIICPDPNWYSADGATVIDFSATDGLFELPVVFVETTDRTFQEGKNYYEYNVETQTYYLTKDKVRQPLKTYYEEDWIASGYENPVTFEYFETNEKTFVTGVTYYERDEEHDTYIQTTDTEYDPLKTYYVLNRNNEYVAATYMAFIPGREYYEYDELTTSYFPTPDYYFILDKTYYEYECYTILGDIESAIHKDINYMGEVETGVTISAIINGDVRGLKILKYYDRYTSGAIEIDDEIINRVMGDYIKSGDEIRICTIKGKKSASLIRDGVAHNILNALGHNPDWFLLDNGLNTFSYATDNGTESMVIFSMNYIKAYEGI